MLRKLLAGTAALAIAGFGVVSMSMTASAQGGDETTAPETTSTETAAVAQGLFPTNDSGYTLDGTSMHTTGAVNVVELDENGKIVLGEDGEPVVIGPAPAGITVQVTDVDGEVLGSGTTNDEGAFDFTANASGTIDDAGCPDVYLAAENTDEYAGFSVKPKCQQEEDPSGSASPSSSASSTSDDDDDDNGNGLPDTGAPAVAGLAALGLTATAAGATLVIRRKK